MMCNAAQYQVPATLDPLGDIDVRWKELKVPIVSGPYKIALATLEGCTKLVAFLCNGEEITIDLPEGERVYVISEDEWARLPQTIHEKEEPK